MLEIELINGHRGWSLPPGGYLVRYNEYVKIPKNTLGLVFPRSSLMRIGGMINTAVWDAGYAGQAVRFATHRRLSRGVSRPGRYDPAGYGLREGAGCRLGGEAFLLRSLFCNGIRQPHAFSDNWRYQIA